MTTNENHENILRKIGEDPILRPFLSGLFDNESYINHIIQENKSEDCLTLIATSTELINEEIQRYITENRDILMSGMQDVASLANQYQTLADHSKGLQTTIHRLKKEVNESYDLVKIKTQELERIHETNFILNQLRQFVKARNQLSQYLKNQDDKDTRSLAATARTIAELEKLILNPKLLEVKIVGNSVNEIKQFSNNIRLLSQANLFNAIEEKNQLEISNYLQVFYNLESLPEIHLSVIDYLVKKTIEATREILDFTNLQALYQDYLNKSGGTSTSSSTQGTSSLALSASKKNLASSAGASNNNLNNSGTVTIAQLRIAMKELGHIWSSMIYDKATQAMALQRVLWKKEDPISHEKFLTVLKQMKPFHASTNGNDPTLTYQYLSNGQLLSLFWYRLSLALHDVCFEKVKDFPAITNRCYLCLRKSLTEILQSIEIWNEEELQRNLGPSIKFMKALMQSNHDPLWKGKTYSRDAERDDDDNDDFLERANDYGGLFGSLKWSKQDIIESGYVQHFLAPMQSSSQISKRFLQQDRTMKTSSKENKPTVNASEKTKPSGNDNTIVDHPLVTGLKPFHDRYLLAVLERMNIPITQMFPELEGYTAAIPSKRDLQTFIKAIQNEFITIIVESDEKIIFSICKEFLKVNKMMLSKISNMTIHNHESRKIINNAGNTIGSSTAALSTAVNAVATTVNFQRNNSQETNLQLLILLLQLKESLEKIPILIMKYLDENALLSASTTTANNNPLSLKGSAEEKSASASASHSSSSLFSPNGLSSHSVMMKEIEKTMSIAIFHIHELAIRDLLSPTIEMIHDYCISLLIPLQKESILYLSKSTFPPTTSNKDPNNLECSFAMQNLLKQLPTLLRTYLFSLPKSYASTILLEYAMEEIAMRIIQSYLSIASLARPFTELTKLKIAKDLSSLEECLSSFCTFHSPSLQKSPILEEYRSFRRYLFEESDAGVKLNVAVATAADGTKATPVSGIPLPPKLPTLLAMDYIHHLRPSVLLGYLIANGPNQLPLPFEMTEKDLNYYLHSVVLNYQQAAVSSTATAGSSVVTLEEGMKRLEKEIQKYYDSQEISSLLLEYSSPSSGITSSTGTTTTTATSSTSSSRKKKEDEFHAQIIYQLFQRNVLNAHNFYPRDASSTSSSSSSSSAAKGVTSFTTDFSSSSPNLLISTKRSYVWKNNLNEKQNWELIQKGLDIFFQRITVIENIEQKQQLRIWYESIMDIGSQFFS